MGGVLVLFIFLLSGVMILRAAPFAMGRQTRIYLGLSLGFALMLWLPSLFAFALNFTVGAQIWALMTACALAVLSSVRALFPRAAKRLERPPARSAEAPLWLCAALTLPLLIFSCYLLYTHTLRPVDGALNVGQSTYGDLCLHLGIATGLRGASFPPEYTLLPGTALGYPFLMDALSASMMLLGTSLRLSFILPSAVALGLVFWGFALLAYRLTRSRRATAIAFALVFLNGGLGFLYTLDFWPSDPSRLLDALWEFYRAPANMPDLNLRWSNLLCDLLIPQRTFLAGWTMLIPAFYLLSRAMETGDRRRFILLGLWAGFMPMVHTHSFLSLGLISLGAMAGSLFSARSDRALLLSRLKNFLLYGCAALLPAIPQLLKWTFPQTIGGGSLRFVFNWVNWNGEGLIDGYFWFWIKNMGPVYLLLLPAALSVKKRWRPLTLGCLLLYAVAELFVFQPNVYDNNKLFYAAFLLMMPFVAEYLVSIYDQLRGIRLRGFLAAVFLAVCLVSGALSCAREAVSDYELFGKGDVLAAEWIEDKTPRDAVFLTGTQHNNPVSSLAGRKIVCGTSLYLYFHGVDTAAQREAVRRMYEEPAENLRLFKQYGVNYIYLSDAERGEFQPDEAALRELFPLRYGDERQYILECVEPQTEN